jgi:hypothetical protein
MAAPDGITGTGRRPGGVKTVEDDILPLLLAVSVVVGRSSGGHGHGVAASASWWRRHKGDDRGE